MQTSVSIEEEGMHVCVRARVFICVRESDSGAENSGNGL